MILGLFSKFSLAKSLTIGYFKIYQEFRSLLVSFFDLPAGRP